MTSSGPRPRNGRCPVCDTPAAAHLVDVVEIYGVTERIERAWACANGHRSDMAEWRQAGILVEARHSAMKFRNETEAEGMPSVAEVLHAELLSAWAELTVAPYRGVGARPPYLAPDATWTVECDNLVQRIGRLTAVAGPVSWEDVDVELIDTAMWETIHRALGVSVDPPDAERLAYVREKIRTAGRI